MSQTEEQNPKKIIESIDSLLVSTGTVAHDIEVDPENNPGAILRVWIKEMSFLQVQKAIKEVVSIDQNGSVNIDLAGYWKYMLTECVDHTEPAMSKVQMFALKPEIANKITDLLPQPQELVAGPLGDGLDA